MTEKTLKKEIRNLRKKGVKRTERYMTRTLLKLAFPKILKDHKVPSLSKSQ